MCQILFLLPFPIPTVRCRCCSVLAAGALVNGFLSSANFSDSSLLSLLATITSPHQLNIHSSYPRMLLSTLWDGYFYHKSQSWNSPRTEEKAGLCWCNCVIRRSTRASAARLVTSVATCVSCVSQKQERWWNHVLARHREPGQRPA